MRTFRRALTAPVIVGLLVTATGCGTAAAAAPAAPTTTAPPSKTLPPSASASAAFPGIWDITSWQQYREAQRSVEQGHQPWLLDPELVVQAWAARWALDIPVQKVAADTFQVTKPGTHVVYTIRGTRPDPTGPAPIWVITQITHS